MPAHISQFALCVILLAPRIAIPQTNRATPPKAPATQKAPIPTFQDIAQQSGLTSSHISSADKHYVVESMSGGVGLFDCDNDGKLDIVMVNGSAGMCIKPVS